MMCNPCFMDANQVGYVHELEWEDVKKMLDDAVSIKPRRQLSVQFSGGEPTGGPGAHWQGVDARSSDEEEQRRGSGDGFFLFGGTSGWASVNSKRRINSQRPASNSRREGGRKTAARTTIAVQGARVHNLKNISLEIPRDSLVVVTGLSGSGKSSLAFDTIYAEGQRRYMESLSSYAKRFVAQVTKPDVDFVFGLSPVISIEQKTLDQQPPLDRRDDDRHRQLPEPPVRHDRRAALSAHQRTDAEPIVQPDPRGDPLAAGRHGNRAAGADIQGLRRGAGLRLHRSAQERLPAPD